MSNSKASQINGNSDLANLKIGVLNNTTTQKFVEDEFPATEKLVFEGSGARSQAVEALRNNTIEALVSDSILSIKELERQGLVADDYTLLPKRPLTCDYYGMLLPDNDSQWRNLVNEFINSQKITQIYSQWLEEFTEDVVFAVDSCNRQR